jgi:hypothetical protein
VEPARVVGLQFESKLVDRILEDVKRARDILSVLEFTLYALWETRKDGKLLHEGYEAIGRHHALIKRAEDVFARFPPGERIEAQRALVQLVTVGEAGLAETRRRVSLDSLSDEGRYLVRYADAGLIVITHSVDGQAFIEFTHDSFVRNWPRLQSWVEEEYHMVHASISRRFFHSRRRRIILAFSLAVFSILAGIALYVAPRFMSNP